MLRNVDIVNPATGEVMKGCAIWFPDRPKLGERWFMAFQEAFEEIAKDKEITIEPRRVLDYLFSKLDFENYIQITQKDIAEALGMQKSHVSRAIKLLTSKQIILESQKTGRSRYFRLNQNYGWKGKVKTFQEAQKERLKVIDGGYQGKASEPL